MSDTVAARNGTAGHAADAVVIRRAIDTLIPPEQVVELRILGTRKGTVSGYFNDREKLISAAVEWSGEAPAVYVTLNPVDSALLARSCNRLTEYAKQTT